MSGRRAGLGLLAVIAACTGRQADPPAGAAAPGTATTGPVAPPTAPGHWPASFGLGQAAPPARIAVLDVDARPDGMGLPPGRGSVAAGELVYRAHCARCHGATGTEGPETVLVGREPGDSFPFARSRANRARQTVGSYWPYATTIFDYVNRAMPQNAPGTLSADELYAVTAYVLFLNEIVARDAVMDATTLPQVTMPSRGRFVPDDRTGGPVVR